MAIRSINAYNDRRYRQESNLATVTKASVIGGLGGYAVKYALPLTKREKTSFNLRTIVNANRKTANKNKVDAIKAAGEENASLAQKAFVKMIDAGKADFSSKNINKILQSLGGDSSGAGAEFKGIISAVDDSARTLAKRNACANRLALKHMRETLPFVVAGVAAGFIFGVIKNVFKYNEA